MAAAPDGMAAAPDAMAAAPDKDIWRHILAAIAQGRPDLLTAGVFRQCRITEKLKNGEGMENCFFCFGSYGFLHQNSRIVMHSLEGAALFVLPSTLLRRGSAIAFVHACEWAGDATEGLFKRLDATDQRQFEQQYGFKRWELARQGAESLSFWWLNEGDTVFHFALKINHGIDWKCNHYRTQKRLLEKLLEHWHQHCCRHSQLDCINEPYDALDRALSETAQHMGESRDSSETFKAAREVLSERQLEHQLRRTAAARTSGFLLSYGLQLETEDLIDSIDTRFSKVYQSGPRLRREQIEARGGPGAQQVHWSAPITRGGLLYYCPPDGWIKIAIRDDAYMETNRQTWPIVYHGTKREYITEILQSRLRAGPRAAYGRKVYVSPSLIYASHETYATWFDAPNCTVQAVLMCQVNLEMVEARRANTLGHRNFLNCDPNHSDETIEWTLEPDLPNGEVSSDKLKICGVMLRVRPV